MSQLRTFSKYFIPMKIYEAIAKSYCLATSKTNAKLDSGYHVSTGMNVAHNSELARIK